MELKGVTIEIIPIEGIEIKDIEIEGIELKDSEDQSHNKNILNSRKDQF